MKLLVRCTFHIYKDAIGQNVLKHFTHALTLTISNMQPAFNKQNLWYKLQKASDSRKKKAARKIDLPTNLSLSAPSGNFGFRAFYS